MGLGHASVVLEHLAKGKGTAKQRKAGEELAAVLALIDPAESLIDGYLRQCRQQNVVPSWLVRDVLDFEFENSPSVRTGEGERRVFSRKASVYARLCAYVGVGSEQATWQELAEATRAFLSPRVDAYGGPKI